MKRRIKVGLFYNLREDYSIEDGKPLDFNADWADIPDTINEIKKAIELNGFDVIDLKDPKLLFSESVRASIDIVFSTCGMQGYRFRESLVPSLCELLKIPYVLSPPDTMMISLDKNLSNMLVKQSGCKVPNWYFIKSMDELYMLEFNEYPYIIKPSADGSGVGITQNSVVTNFQQLEKQINLTLNLYDQPVIVQKYLTGKELTIAVIERCSQITCLTPLEILPIVPSSKFIYNFEVKEKADKIVEFKPVSLNQNLMQKIYDTTVKSFIAVGCRDAARVDLRMSANNEEIYFLEINPIPHFHPLIGDFCRSARAYGLPYQELMRLIINNALTRYCIV